MSACEHGISKLEDCLRCEIARLFHENRRLSIHLEAREKLLVHTEKKLDAAETALAKLRDARERLQ